MNVARGAGSARKCHTPVVSPSGLSGSSPCSQPSLTSAWLLVFLPSIRELSSSILLFTTRSRVVSVVIYSLYEEGLWEAVSALGILLLGLTLALVAVAQRFLGRRFLQT